MTFEEWWTNEMGKDYPTGRYIAEQAYAAGRESMRIECLQECSAEATDNGTAQRIEKAIGELK